jgi:hypothetical protein
LCVTEFRSDRVTILADRMAVLKIEIFRQQLLTSLATSFAVHSIRSIYD